MKTSTVSQTKKVNLNSSKWVITTRSRQRNGNRINTNNSLYKPIHKVLTNNSSRRDRQDISYGTKG